MDRMKLRDNEVRSKRSKLTFRNPKKTAHFNKKELSPAIPENRIEAKDILEEEANSIKRQIEDLRIFYRDFSNKTIRLQRIDKTFKRILCTQNYSETIRLLLLSESSFQEYNRGDIIYKQGGFIRNMFFVLKGSISLNRANKSKEIKVIRRVYEGMDFGQYSMIDDKLDRESCGVFISKLINRFSLPPFTPEQREMLSSLENESRINCRNHGAVAETYTAVIKVPVEFYLRCKFT